MTQSPIPVSPLAEPFPEIAPLAGASLSVAEAGLYPRRRADVLLMRFPRGAAAAGVFTRHAVGSAPVDWCRRALAASGGSVRALLVNAGCANAFTGDAGDAAVRALAEAVSAELGCADDEVLAASTGVIGQLLPYGKILNVLQDLIAPRREAGFEEAARAIMTTDTFPKGAEARFEAFGRTWRVVGFCKGSGMIAPNMATMLAFVATDAAVAPEALRRVLEPAVDATLNCVTVDGDRSTNDSCFLIAAGAGPERIVDPASPEGAAFAGAVSSVLSSLSRQLARDGEGASKFVQVRVEGAVDAASARRIARTICESPLVKTAVAGEDANWGRIVMAVGRADEPVDRRRISIWFGDLEAARDGAVSPAYDEAAMSAYMRRAELAIRVRVGEGPGSADFLTCDLTHGYVSINGDYRS